MRALLRLPYRAVVRSWRIAAFLSYFSFEFLKSNALVLWEILTPGTGTAPAVVEVPLHGRTRVEVVSIANLVTLTPGTLSLEVVLDPPIIYVHGMFVHDPVEFVAQVHRMEARLLAALRPVGDAPAATDVPGNAGR